MRLLFGAGHYALAVKRYLQDQGKEISGVLVSKKKMDCFDELPIYTPKEVSYLKKECEIVFGLSERYHEEVEALLRREGFQQFIYYSDETLQAIYEKYNSVNDWIIDKYHKFLPQKKRKPDSLNNALVIRLDGIGDAVMTTPFLRELRHNLPNSKITLLISDLAYNLFELCPYVDRVVSVDWKNEIMNGLIDDNLQNAKRFMTERFNGENYDTVIMPRYDVDWYGATFLSLFSNASYRLAYSEKTTSLKSGVNKNYDQLFSHVLYGDGVCHEVERNMQILNELGMEGQDNRLELWQTEEDTRFVTNIIEDKYKFLFKDKIIAIGLAATAKFRQWHHGNYVSVINRLFELEGARTCFVLLGGPKEESIGKRIRRDASTKNIIDLTNKLSLRQVYCLLKRCSLYIGNDSGLMHIACAAEIPVIEISPFPINATANHPNSPIRFGPWKTKHAILQPENGIWAGEAWCNKNGAYSINDILPQCVIETVCKMKGQ